MDPLLLCSRIPVIHLSHAVKVINPIAPALVPFTSEELWYGYWSCCHFSEESSADNANCSTWASVRFA